MKMGDVILVDNFALNSPKTKEFVGTLSALQIQGSALLVTQGGDRNLTLASRNVSSVEVSTSEQLSTYQVLRFDKLLFTREAFEKLEARLNKEKQP